MNYLQDENVDWYNWLEKRVCVKDTLFGTLKYFGATKFCDGLWCGIELDEPVGKNNGTVNNVKYFTCMPRFGIFVPMSKVCKIENDPKNFNGTFTHLDETFKVQNCKENTILVSDSHNLSYNCSKENENISDIVIEKALNVRQDSEESLGLLDPNLLESLTNSWDSFNIDAAAVIGDIAPDIQESMLKLENQTSDFTDPYLPRNSLFSDEISYPKYASTPRQPVKKRFTHFIDIDDMALTLQNVNERNDVLENKGNCVQDVFFATEKFKDNPNLVSTCKISSTSSDTNINCVQDVFFDSEKLKNNPNLTSTNKIFGTPSDTNLNCAQDFFFESEKFENNPNLAPTCKATSSLDTNINVMSPVLCNNSLYSIDLNKTQIIPVPCMIHQRNVPILMDLNKTQTLQTECKASISNIHMLNATFKMFTGTEPQIDGEDKDESLFQKTFVLSSSSSEKEQSGRQTVSADALSDKVVQFESFDYKSKFLEETTILEKSLSDVNLRNSVSIPVKSYNTLNCSQRFSSNFDLNSTFHKKDKVTENNSMASKNPKSLSNIHLKANNVEKKVVEFKKPLSMYSSIRKIKAPLKKIASTDAKEKENSSYLKEIVLVHTDEPLVSNESLKKNESPVDIKLEQEKENRSFHSIENESVLSDKSLVSNIKSKKGRLSASFDLDNKLNRLSKVAVNSRYSRRISYSQSAESTGLSNTTGDLPLQSKDNRSLKNSNKIKFPASSRVVTSKDLNVHDASKVPLNIEKKTVFLKQAINKTNGLAKNPSMSQLKKPATKDKLLVSRQSLGLSSIGGGIPRRNSLAASSKTNLPVGIIKPRYSMLPSIKEQSLIKTKNTGPIVEQLTKSSDPFVPDVVPIVSSCTTASSSKSSRIASSLPQKSAIATRKVGQKYSDVKVESGACPKIARYNLRGKK